MDSTLEDVKRNRDLCMDLYPEQFGVLTVRTSDWVGDLPEPGAIEYLVSASLEGDQAVFRFDVPEGAPRKHRYPSGSRRPVLIGSPEDLEAQARGL